jgi:hypothetical protein
MPTVLPKGSVPEALGTEPATRNSILQSITKLVEQYQQEQFLVLQSGVVFNSGLNQLQVSYGQGQIRWPAIAYRFFAAGTAVFNAPAASTNYVLVAKSDVTASKAGAGSMGSLPRLEAFT